MLTCLLDVALRLVSLAFGFSRLSSPVTLYHRLLVALPVTFVCGVLGLVLCGHVASFSRLVFGFPLMSGFPAHVGLSRSFSGPANPTPAVKSRPEPDPLLRHSAYPFLTRITGSSLSAGPRPEPVEVRDQRPGRSGYCTRVVVKRGIETSGSAGENAAAARGGEPILSKASRQSGDGPIAHRIQS